MAHELPLKSKDENRQLTPPETNGTAIRMNYWFMYVAEGKAMAAKTKYKPTIAVGCAAVKNQATGKRCTLGQFLDYLWAPQVDANGKPKPDSHRPATIRLPANFRKENYD